MMITDPELGKDLQFLNSQRSWVYREIPEENVAQVLSPPSIPKATGVYWIAGETVLHCGRRLDSVFQVDTDSGGELMSVYWHIGGQWYKHDDEDVLRALEVSRDDVFPFDWSFAVPLEEDVFHS
jgi:hypothetical protein